MWSSSAARDTNGGVPPTDEPDETTPEDPDDPTAIAEDGMAPLINNTGADADGDDDADASSG